MLRVYETSVQSFLRLYTVSSDGLTKRYRYPFILYRKKTLPTISDMIVVHCQELRSPLVNKTTTMYYMRLDPTWIDETNTGN